MTTRTVLAIAMCATVVLAGCAGLGGGGDNGTTASGAATTEATAIAEADTTAAGGEETTTAEDTATTAAEDEGTTTAAAATATTAGTMMGDDTTMATTTAMPTAGESPTITTGDVAGSEAFRFLAFEQPGTYTYEVTTGGSDGQEQSGEYVIDVVQASDDQYEVQVSFSMGEMSNQQTFTGTRQAVQQQMLSSQAGAFLAPLTTMTGFYGGRPLQVGQSWSSSSQQGTVGFEVTGEDSYAGVDCFVSQASLNGTTVHEACVSPDRGLAPYTVYYDESGTLTFEMELTSYEAG
ncbi:hypothetical protein [Halococcus saccharolyticus]|uniref:Lipoprotein n=1 Tax=Halococcus saccharolyticus DSM 5350 TaxID=1227455 RepID=M0MJ74_9EURY|nr:hypothetical protein [Halococcus saccharolyticus]EMA45408.1 hypothetical protein C449_07285 [Halococcus saccharolyticus DSM 5350]